MEYTMRYYMKRAEDITYEEYQNLLDKWKNNNDFREINIQNEVIKPFVQSICSDLDVIDMSKKGPRSEIHDYLKYCGTYEDKNGNKKATTPDLVIADGWNWRNIENKVDYIFTIEVKSPFLSDRIYNKDIYPDSLNTEIERHLSAKENSRVILTDGLKWIFYKETIMDPKIFCLYEYNDDLKKWDWKYDSVTFNELKEYIREFSGKNTVN